MARFNIFFADVVILVFVYFVQYIVFGIRRNLIDHEHHLTALLLGESAVAFRILKVHCRKIRIVYERRLSAATYPKTAVSEYSGASIIIAGEHVVYVIGRFIRCGSNELPVDFLFHNFRRTDVMERDSVTFAVMLVHQTRLEFELQRIGNAVFILNQMHILSVVEFGKTRELSRILVIGGERYRNGLRFVEDIQRLGVYDREFYSLCVGHYITVRRFAHAVANGKIGAETGRGTIGNYIRRGSIRAVRLVLHRHRNKRRMLFYILRIRIKAIYVVNDLSVQCGNGGVGVDAGYNGILRIMHVACQRHAVYRSGLLVKNTARSKIRVIRKIRP